MGIASRFNHLSGLPGRAFLLQFAWYLVVGGLGVLLDLAIFVLLLAAGVAVLWASAIGFITGAVANYFLSTWLAFRRGRFGRPMEIGAFVVVVLVGLGFTTALMYMLTSWVRLPGIPAKLLTIAIVMTWNFLGRRFFVFKPDLPAGTAAFSTRLLERFAEKHAPNQ
jgi:putative flippase GtrA